MFTLIRNITASKWIVASAAAIALAVPGVSQARDNRDIPVEHREVEHREVEHRDFDHHEFDRHEFDRHDFGFRFGFSTDFFPVVIHEEVAPPAPVYQTVTERQWVEPVYQTVVQNVWVPDQFEDRTVTYFVRGRQYTRVDRVLVAPGHYESRATQVLVSEGHWIDVQKQVLVNCD